MTKDYRWRDSLDEAPVGKRVLVYGYFPDLGIDTVAIGVKLKNGWWHIWGSDLKIKPALWCNLFAVLKWPTDDS